jgi:hypothetical protein
MGLLLSVVLMGTLLPTAEPARAVVRAGGAQYPPDPAGLIERLAAGNIDQPGHEAYNRWGTGYEHHLQASDRKFQRRLH